MNELAGRVSVITGAARGIGEALARACAAAGMKLFLADRDGAPLTALAAELGAGGVEVETHVVDVGHHQAVQAMADACYTRFGAAHLLCNNAGVSLSGFTWELEIEDWKWQLDVNLWGVVHGVRAFVPRMIAGGDAGHVVNTASMAGLLAPPGLSAYAASKHAVVALTETLNHELVMVGSRLRASVLCPGWVSTAIMAGGRRRAASEESSRRLAAIEQHYADAVKGGRSAADIAAATLAGVRAQRVHILTHPEMDKDVRARFETALARG